MSPFKNLKERFAYKDSSLKSPSEIIIRKHQRQISKPPKPTKPTIPSSSDQSIYDKYKDYKPLPDILDNELDLIFVGYNPSLRSSEVGHRYAHHSNRFWKLIYESKVVNKKLTPYDDYSMLKEYKIGFTELVEQPTKNIDEIPKNDMKNSVPILINKINRYNPKIVCIVGKGIWELMSSNLKLNKTKGEKFVWGLQNQNSFNCKVFVLPSTSALVRMPIEQIRNIWIDLKKVLDETTYLDNK